MAKIKKQRLLLALLSLALCLSGCSGNGGVASDTAASPAQTDAVPLVLSVSGLSGEPRFYDWDQNGTVMQLIALKSEEGEVQLAYNTCQSCAGSPYAYFEYQNGVLVCQSCMNRFGLDSVGRVAGGCNPMPVTDYQLDGDQVIIPADGLAKAAPSFRNWKVFK